MCFHKCICIFFLSDYLFVCLLVGFVLRGWERGKLDDANMTLRASKGKEELPGWVDNIDFDQD